MDEASDSTELTPRPRPVSTELTPRPRPVRLYSSRSPAWRVLPLIMGLAAGIALFGILTLLS